MNYDSLAVALAFLKDHPKWFIFPITRFAKAPPCFEDNLAKASNNPLQIRKWHAIYFGCNWGLSLKKSDVIVLDVDTKPGKNGQATLDDLEMEHGELPATLKVKTPSGGFHYYFNGAHKFGLGKYLFGKDLDSPNYVLLPGCWINSKEYTRDYSVVADNPVADAPEWFAERFKAKEAEKAERANDNGEPGVDLDKDENIAWAITYLTTTAPNCIEGRNGEKALLDVSAVLKDRAISEYQAIELLSKYYNVPADPIDPAAHPYCEPLWAVGEGNADADRLDVKVGNAYRYLKENIAGSATAEFAFTGDNKITQDDLDDIPRLRKKAAKIEAERITTVAAQNAKVGTQTEFTDRAQGVVDSPAETLSDREAAKREAANERRKARAEKERVAEAFATEAAEGELPLGGPPSIDDDDDPDEDPLGGPSTKKDDKSPDEKTAFDNIKGGEKTVQWLARNWVWVVGLERFVRIEDSVMWKAKQFDSRFNHMSKKPSMAGSLFKVDGSIKRFDRASFRPGQGMILDGGVALNLWRASPITAQPGNTDLWDEHLNYLFQDINDRDHVLNWMAWVYQNQASKPNHALLIVGKNTGTGKSFIARVLEQLLGKDNTQRPKNSSLKGDFNGWALRCKLCIIEELMQIGRREVANELRDIITEPTIEVNIKNIPAQLSENYMAMMGISNHPDALPIDETDRRWLVVSTPVSRRDPAYYDKLFKILEDPKALGAIAYALQQRKLGEYSAVTSAPVTAAKLEMIELSRSDAETWLFDNVGNVPLNRNLVTVQDVVDAMPATIQRQARLASTIIPNFLRDKLKGEKVGYIRLSDKRRVYMWGLHGRGGMVPAGTAAAVYEAERKAGFKTAEEEAADDFGTT